MLCLFKRIVAPKQAITAIVNNSTRFASSTKQQQPPVDQDEIKKSVFISQSTDIYTNLALEDWFYRNSDLNKHHVLLLWRNEPTVVVGRHQNPWVEANVPVLDDNHISLARRNSGGGTVYHDLGNLNLSFFTPRDRYNRNYNLNIITRALYREWGLKSEINKREDIVVDGDFKVSGTAAKLGRPNAYHHCTLLVSANKTALSLALKKEDIKMDTLLNAIGWEYLRTKAYELEDGGHDLIEKQKGFQYVNPSEDWFPGITKLLDEFRSWEWIHGKTPKFKVTRVLEGVASNGQVHRMNLIVEVENGLIKDIRLSLPPDFLPANFSENASVVSDVHGSKYSHDIVEKIVSSIGCKTVAMSGNEVVDKSNVAASQ